MEKVLKKFERYLVVILLVLMILTVIGTTIELVSVLVSQLKKPPFLALNIEEAIEVFGFFLMVLIGLELLESIKIYLRGNRVHAEVVFLVAILLYVEK